jgi:hypothetical protein
MSAHTLLVIKIGHTKEPRDVKGDHSLLSWVLPGHLLRLEGIPCRRLLQHGGPIWHIGYATITSPPEAKAMKASFDLNCQLSRRRVTIVRNLFHLGSLQIYSAFGIV